MDLAKLQTDAEKENDGVWVELQPGVRVKLARWNNAKFQNVQFKKMLPYRNTMAGGEIEFGIVEKITIECTAETVLLDWDGIEWDGEPLESSLANRLRVLTDVPDFRSMIVNLASQREYFMAKAEQDIAGNSPGSSNGTVSTASTKVGLEV